MDKATERKVKARLSLLASDVVDAGMAFGEGDTLRTNDILRVIADKARELQKTLATGEVGR